MYIKQTISIKGYLTVAFDLFIAVFLAASLAGCTHHGAGANGPSLFTQLPATQSGILFNNEIKEDDSTGSFIDEFGYMGGGVGIGDFNNDGLKDIFFTGNQVSCRLYMNKGHNSFEDVTEKAGLSTHVWATGVSIVDINNDGYDDIYICVFGRNLLQRSQNLLYINQRNGTFKEQAEAYGLADMGYSTQAVFFDYDKDGDLDMYLTHYLLNGPNANTVFPKDLSGHSTANDRLFRNDGDRKGTGHPFFTDVTEQAHIRDCGYGLGVVVSDLNCDGWPDLYVADDFVSDDLLWLNDRNGAFTDRLSTSMAHTSYSSMGVDAADLNNDGWPDIVTLDMLPEYNRRKKTTFSFMNYERYQLERSLGYHPQFMRNMLQLNNGAYQKGDTSIPFFSEIGEMAGISATDWSWSVLLADFDNDGWKDMHITNGIGRDFINADFLDFSSSIFSGTKTKEEQHHLIRQRLASLDHINLKNYLYLNNKDYTFTDASAQAGIDAPSMSGGAAYVDLDNDGDLDLVVNNINKQAFVFLNNTIEKDKPVTRHYLSVELKGDSLNKAGFGAKIKLYCGDSLQMQEQAPVRGYFSSVDQKLLFGLGAHLFADSVLITWPDNRTQTLYKVPADTLLVLHNSPLTTDHSLLTTHASYLTTHNSPLTTPLTALLPYLTTDHSPPTISFRHTENVYNDFATQVLLPRKYSQLGPFIATGDINKDGLMDFFIGGAFNSSGRFFIQQRDGRFIQKTLTDSIKLQEDMDCALFDADGDGDLDLLVTSGDLLYEEQSENYLPRLYRNDGKGNFSPALSAIPGNVKTSAGCLGIGDFNGDGRPDLFIGGRVSRNYPLSPRSFLLENEGGHFKDVTEQVCPALSKGGMISAAKWMDFDQDGRLDLVVAGEWMPIRFFKNNGKGRLEEVTGSTGLETMNGMWQSLAVADMDGDGDLDIVAGNLGLNCEYKAGEKTPMEIFAGDLDGNGSIDPVLCYYIKDEDGIRRSFPAASRKKLSEQIPFVKKKFLYNRDYARANFTDLYKTRPGDSLLRLYCNETRSCYFENIGHGRFVKHPLPAEAQFAPVNAIVCEDIDHDGILDLLLAGNDYQAEVMRGRYDASYGCLLKGNGRNGFVYMPGARSGLLLQGDIKALAILPIGDSKHPPSGSNKLLLAACNNDSLRVLKIK